MSYKSERFKNNNEYVWFECKDSKDIEYFLDAFNRALEKISDIDYELLEDEALQYGPDNIDRYFDKFSLYILKNLDHLEKSRFDIFDYVKREKITNYYNESCDDKYASIFEKVMNH